MFHEKSANCHNKVTIYGFCSSEAKGPKLLAECMRQKGCPTKTRCSDDEDDEDDKMASGPERQCEGECGW